MISIVDIGASEVAEGAMVVQTGNSDDEEFQAFDDVPVFGTLGLASRPFPADASACQALIAETPASVQVVAMRDVRNADVLATLEPGDSVVFSSGPALIRIYLRENGEVQVTNASKFTVGDAGAAKALAIAELVEARIQTIVDAISNAVPVPQDGGAGLQATIVAALSGATQPVGCEKTFSE